MKITTMIDDYGAPYRPYMGNLVNHLPMGQLALYKLTEDIDWVKEYSEFYVGHFTVDPVKETEEEVKSIEECVGKRELYEACLSLVKEEIEKRGAEDLIREVLNSYPLGMSSGLFHVLIRLAYAKEGMDLAGGVTEEVQRALAYYITAYREATPFSRWVPRGEGLKEMAKLQNSSVVDAVLSRNLSRGQTMKALYDSGDYLEKGFLFEGTDGEKVQAILDLCLPAFDQTVSIVVLHCVTGLHALTVLKEYFEDFSEALDIYTATAITHLLTVEDIDYMKKTEDQPEDWNRLIDEGSQSKDVHTIKFTYTCRELEKLQAREGLRVSLSNKIRK